MRAAALVCTLAFAAAAPGQSDLPPGRGPVPLRRDGPGVPPPADVPLPTPVPLDPEPPDRGQPALPRAPGGRNDAGDLPPRPGDRRPPAGPDPPNALEAGPAWPQRRDPDRDDEYSPRYRYTHTGEQPVRFQPTTISHDRHELDLPIPFLLEKTDLFGASVRVRDTMTATRAVLPDSGRLFPKDLWEVSLGVGYLHRFDNGWSAGVLPRVGTLTDKPFQSTRELNLSLIAFVRAPAYLQGDYWNFSLLYFPNSALPFPIPGVAYEWNPDPTLRVSVGIPTSVRWRFLPDWQFDFDYRPITQVNSRLSYDVRQGFRVYTGFNWDSDGYYLADRVNRRDLFFLQEKRLAGGVRADLTDLLTLDLSGGLAFDRSYGVGRTSVDYRSDRVDARRGGFISAWLLLQF